MLVKQKLGNINTIKIDGLSIDYVQLQWYETNKRILHTKTNAGIEIILKFLQENQQLTDGDILYMDEKIVVLVDVMPCDCIVLSPTTMYDMASVCYEIGNKHLPLYFEKDALLIPFEQPIFNLLQAQGFDVKQEKRKLIQPLKTTVAAHGNASESLFSKILKMTNG